MLRAIGWALLAVLVSAGPSRANDTLNRSGMFDPPLRQQVVPAPTGADGSAALTCTYYADVMVLETGSDSPDPGPAYVVPVLRGAPPACLARASAHATAMKTDGYGLEGRKSGFLIFSQVGDVPSSPGMLVVHLPDGRTIYSDTVVEHGLSNVRDIALQGDDLHIAYTRSVNGECSLPKDGAACWASLTKAGHLSRAVASQPPPVAACTAAYRKAKLPIGSASVLIYDVAIQLTSAGHATVLNRGPLSCDDTAN